MAWRPEGRPGSGVLVFQFVLVRRVVFGVQLARFGGVVSGVEGVALSHLGMVSRRFRALVLVVVGRVVVMFGGVFVMFGRETVMLRDTMGGGGHYGAS